jgi:hypothetical protein
MLIAIAEVVFAKLAGSIALGLEQFSDGGIFRPREPLKNPLKSLQIQD